MRLREKVVIVTGSTQGIGEAVARRCVAEGARVVVHGLEREAGERVARELGAGVVFCCNDLSEPEAADELVRVTVGAFGRIDGIVNNAASTRRATLEQTDAATFDFFMHLNLRAPLLLIRAALPHLLESKGSVVNVGSVNAYCGAANLLPYSISKGGLMTLTRNIADTYAQTGLRVNQLNLGWVLTENEKRMMEAGGHPTDWWKDPPRDGAPVGRLILPEEIATAVVYWLGDESRPISGSVLELNQYPIIGRNSVKEKE